ncbi:MAG: hypothetical protein IPJ65_35490 [Archangiaceae bacterium]|nr:hypothetical protein [Archangiaceae bacterium]
MKASTVLVLGGTVVAIGALFLVGSASRTRPGSGSAEYFGANALEKKSMRSFGEDAPMAAPEAPAPPPAQAAALDQLGGLGVGRGGGGKGLLGGSLRDFDEGAMGKKDARLKRKAEPKAPRDEEAKESANGPTGGEGGVAAPATRAWFPETFLFRPLIVTDANGLATVPVKVPDRLTTWHVLALAHSRQGAQAGTTADFLGTLPTYVDPVVPPFLIAGDEVRLPVQVVNTTPAAISTRLELSAIGGTLSTAGGAVKVPAEGSEVQYVTLKVPRPGIAALRATLGSTDAIEREVPVKPQGQLVTVSTGGTLAAPRSFPLDGPKDPLAGSEKVKVLVFPGALSLVKSELSASPGRGGVAEDAYTLLLAGRAAGLLSSLGATPDTAAIRDVGVLAGQRAIRHARSPDVPTAALLTEAALAHGDNPVMSRLGERLAAQVARAQRPDGTCQGQTGWSLQRLLVTTAECVRAVRASQSTPQARARANNVTVKASGAFERNLARVEDPYTAAAILASGAARGPLAEELKKRVVNGLETRPDGAKVLPVASGVVRADGLPPSVNEATATAVLALGTAAPESADLGTALLGGYSPYFGWGDGRANLLALRAVVELFKQPVPAKVRIVLERDGKAVADGTLDAAKLQDVLTLNAEVEGSSGTHTWGLRSEPAVPGLGFSLTLQAHVPWKDEAPSPGLELNVAMPEGLEVGKASDLKVTVAAPSGVATLLKLALPAGVQADRPGLEALVAAGRVTRFETEDGALKLHLPAQVGGATFEAAVRVVPTLAGTLHADATTLSPEGKPQLARAFKPAVWKVK